MSDDSVTVELELSEELLGAMRRVRRNQRVDRRTRTAELSEESPGDVVAQLIKRAYSDHLRQARTRDDDARPGEQWL